MLVLSRASVSSERADEEQDLALSLLGVEFCCSWIDSTCRCGLAGIVLQSRGLRAVCNSLRLLLSA